MSIAENIKTFLTKRMNNEEVKAPENLCPNCWGRQEYGGIFYEAMKAEKIDVNNIDQKKGWIQAYAEKNLTKIQLKKKGDHLACEVCYTNVNPD